MRFSRQTGEAGQELLVNAILLPLQEQKTVLWLISGGSNIKIATAVMAKLIGNESNLWVTLTDERYGKVGHPDSNWQQLLEAGFDPGHAKTYPILRTGLDLAQ